MCVKNNYNNDNNMYTYCYNNIYLSICFSLFVVLFYHLQFMFRFFFARIYNKKPKFHLKFANFSLNKSVQTFIQSKIGVIF